MSNIPLEERVNWIGASESAALFDASPFTTYFALWCEKARLVPPQDLDGNESTERGQFMEPAIGAWASYRWGMGLRKVAYYLPHPRVAGLGASLDFEDAEGNPVEIKSVRFDRFAPENGWVVDGHDLVDAPLHYLIQVQTQLACRPGAPHGWLVVGVYGGSLFRLKIQRNEALIAAIEEEAALFWRLIDAGQMPSPDYSRRSDAEIIKALHPGAHGFVDLTRSNRAAHLCAEIAEASAIEAEARARAKAARAELNDLMGSHAEAAVQGYRVTRKIVPAATIPATVREAYPRLYISQNRKGRS